MCKLFNADFVNLYRQVSVRKVRAKKTKNILFERAEK